MDRAPVCRGVDSTGQIGAHFGFVFFQRFYSLQTTHEKNINTTAVISIEPYLDDKGMCTPFLTRLTIMYTLTLENNKLYSRNTIFLAHK